MSTLAWIASWIAAAALVAAAVLSFFQTRIAGRKRWLGLGLLLLLAAVTVSLTTESWFFRLVGLDSRRHEVVGSLVTLLASVLVLVTLLAASRLLRRMQESLTAIRGLQEESERIRRRYELVAEAVPDGLVILENGRIRYANRAFSVIVGIDRREVRGRVLAEVLDPSGRHSIPPPKAVGAAEDRAENGPPAVDILYRRPEGGQRWLEVRLIGTAGPESLEVGLIRDVTEERRITNLRQVLYEMSVEAQRVQEPGELFSALQQVLGRVMDARNLFVALHDRDRDLLTFPFYRDQAEPRAPDPMPPGKTLTAQVLRSGKPLFLHSPEYWELEERGEVELVGPDAKDWLGVPLVLHGKTAGVLAVQSYEAENLFGEYELSLLTTVAGHLARLLELKEAERQVRERERHYRAIFDHSPAGIFHFDGSLTLTDCNERLAAILGSSRERLVGLDMKQLRDRSIIPILERTMAGQEGSFEGWYEPTTGDRGRVWLVGRLAPIFDEEGRPVGGVAIVEDQTATRLAEEELRRRDSIIEALSSVGQRFLSCEDPEEAVARALAKLGRSAQVDRIGIYQVIEPEPGRIELLPIRAWSEEGFEHAGPPCPERVGPEFVARWVGHLREGRVLTRPVGELASGEEEELRARCGLQSLALIPVPVADRWWGFMVFEDHRRVRQWFETEIEALRLAAATLGAAIHHRETEQRLRTVEKMEAIGQLTSGIAHDFNNLLMAIQGAVEQLHQRIEDVSDHAFRENLEIIEAASRRAASMTRHLLAFSRRQVMEPRPLDLNELLRHVLPTARRILPENIEIRLDLAESVGSIKADPGQVEQILMNLLVNSRDAMPAGGTITIATSDVIVDGELIGEHPWATAGAHVRLTVSDTGRGMDSETLAHVFEPFFTTKGPGEGTGLGLSTVYGIVKQHGGMVHLSSEPGRGTTAEIYFPRVEASPVPIAPAARQPAEGGSETILLVEDDPGVRRVVRNLLSALGYRIVTAEDGRRALELLEERDGTVDLVVSDVVMPRMGGQELATAAVERWPDLRFLFMTGYSGDAVHDGFVKKEGVSFLTKPFSRDDLARAVRSVLGG
ncbi:MAG TPA: PAS domain S-box protein [Acidobacteria bacterium]|nr:PAS domain S-box protein [Acidobacteriota bacterium]